jgi:flagellin
MSIQVGANDGQTINIDLQKIDSSTLGLGGFSVSNNALKLSDSITQVGVSGSLKDVNLKSVASDLSAALGKTVSDSELSLHNVKDGTNDVYVVSYGSDNYAVSIDDASGGIELNTAKITYTDANGGTGTLSGVPVKVGASSAGATTAYAEVQGNNYSLSTASLANSGDTTGTKDVAEAVDMTTDKFTGASSASPLALLDKAIAQVDTFRSSLGAVQNRLDSAVTNLNNTTTNLSEAQSRIQDADYATEVSNMSKAQIIQQAGNSVLSKANQVPQQVLSLLQG